MIYECINRKKSRVNLEFSLLDKDSVVYEFKKQISKLVDEFGNSGQSGGSAPFVAKAISDAVFKLCMQQPISPITLNPNEWNLVHSSDSTMCFQNARCSSLFIENGVIYNIDAVVFKSESGSTFTSSSVNMPESEDKISSFWEIKSFPFTPKTFYIDVIETEWADREGTIKEEGGGWWSSVIKDVNQLQEVYNYYKRPYVK